jgi:pimeloyl-ACP methyl ester carboxylesterase
MRIPEYMALSREGQEQHLETLSPRELLQHGTDLFNAGHYWHSHEAWEAVWLDAPRELRAFYQGLIQVAAGLVHLTRNEYPGTERLLEEGIAKLERYPPDYLTVEVARLVFDATATRRRVLEAGPKGLRAIDHASLPRVEQQPAGASHWWSEDGARLHWLEWEAEQANGPFDRAQDKRTSWPPTSAHPEALEGSSEAVGESEALRELRQGTVVLLHAPGHVARLWQPIAARLAVAGYRVVAPDLPGHGESEPLALASDDEGDAIETEVERLRRWLAAAAPEPIAIAGLGAGAGLVARLAAESGAIEVVLAPHEVTGPGDGDVSRSRRQLWPSRNEMFATLVRRSLFARWRHDLLWTYVEYGTRSLANGQGQLCCSDAVEARFLSLGRPLDHTTEIDVSPLSQPVEAGQALQNALTAAYR